MNLNMNKELLSLDGNPVITEGKPIMMSKFLAQKLAAGQSDDAIKSLNWALNLYNKGEIEVDPSDLNKLKAFVSNDQTMTNLAKGAILTEIENCK